MPEQMILRLSESFETNDSEPTVEVVARVLNVNYGKNRELLDRCQRLYGYAYLIHQVRSYTDQGLVLEAAMDRAIEDCIGQGILKQFLLKHRGEVTDVILTRYDAAFHIQCEKQESFEEGEQSGLLTGIRQGIFALISDNLEEHVPAERIVQKLQKHFHLTQEKAQEWMARYEQECLSK